MNKAEHKKFAQWLQKRAWVDMDKDFEDLVDEYFEVELASNTEIIGGVSKRYIAVTYMIYIILWKAPIIGGFGYIVFVLNRSGWWILLAVLLSASAYNPKSWRKLF